MNSLGSGAWPENLAWEKSKFGCSSWNQSRRTFCLSCCSFYGSKLEWILKGASHVEPGWTFYKVMTISESSIVQKLWSWSTVWESSKFINGWHPLALMRIDLLVILTSIFLDWNFAPKSTLFSLRYFWRFSLDNLIKTEISLYPCSHSYIIVSLITI